ncbi:hypothetical protein C461_05702 [Halorubrum aidingense JCM 13560]|uniref:40-residue YVTN family beta-propeller repeat-containing protein n=1 Tax=Halorubrum aidingense JCM 13560 TaxID=1230454 RepID=M0PGC1_9EURY|nr:twin-arginine translocation signal domain-containing protein [Halorubrum aidingense]EMA69101.1 hypothetical protein C461_05702 [Halorubrum aidingense JCM 13560]
MSDDCDCTTNEPAPRPSKGSDLANDRRTNPFAAGVDRRRLLQASGAVGAATALAGCSDDGGSGGDGDAAPTMFVFNNGDRTVSVLDAEADELITSVYLDTTASFPANQYTTGIDDEYDVLWLNVSGGVRAFDQRTLDELAFVETGYGPNYPNATPDGDHLLIASGGTTGMAPEGDEAHAIFRVDADRDSDAFGEVTGEIETGYVGPCDMTLGPDGDYAFVVDVADESIRVLSVDPFETVARVDAGEPANEEGGNVLPFMCTASFDGQYLLVENGEGTLGSDPEVPRVGSESVWDISDPENPEEVAKITRDDGLPGAPITSEVAPDNAAAYLLIPGAGVGVIDLESFEYETTLDVGGNAISAAWGPNREKLYVPVQDANEVAVIDHERREVVATVDAGAGPTGAVAGTVRPEGDAVAQIRASLASLGLAVGDMEATYCMDGHCYCG